MTERWYAVVDDLVGGWAIATIDLPLSEVRHNGAREVACFIDEADARRIAKLNNDEIDNVVWVTEIAQTPFEVQKTLVEASTDLRAARDTAMGEVAGWFRPRLEKVVEWLSRPLR